MRLTDEQFEALAPYEKNFDTMVRAKYTRNPGIRGLDLMYDTYEAVTGIKQGHHYSCSRCIKNIVRDMGKIWLADKEERIAKANDAKAVELTEAEVKPKRKRTVKTKTTKE